MSQASRKRGLFAINAVMTSFGLPWRSVSGAAVHRRASKLGSGSA
jgi:hypothetical protein